MPLFPGTGYKNETGQGNIFNFPLGSNSDGFEFSNACKTKSTESSRDIKNRVIFGSVMVNGSLFLI